MSTGEAWPGTGWGHRKHQVRNGEARALTFLHGDGGFLLPQAQQDEEQDQGYEELKGQDPLQEP